MRHGTTTLFAALEIATGKVTAACKPRHRRQEFGAFLRQVARAYPAGELHLVMDNYAAHKTPEIKAWLRANPRVTVHFTPTHASWMNLVEVWFSIIERQAIHRGTYRSVKDLNAKIRQFIDGWNCPASSRWQVLGLGEVGGLRVGVAEVDLDRAVPGQVLVRSDGVVLDPVVLGVGGQVDRVGDLFEEQPLVLQGPEAAFVRRYRSVTAA